MSIHSSGQTVFRLPHIGGITLGAGEEEDEVAERVCGMGADRIGGIGDRASERQAAGCMGAGFTPRPRTRKGARDGLRGTGNKISSDKELTEKKVASGVIG